MLAPIMVPGPTARPANLATREGVSSFSAETVMDYWMNDQRVKGGVLVMGTTGSQVRINALSPAGNDVIADATTRPDFAAADLLAQAEHAPGASILVTWHAELLSATHSELQKQVAGLSRCEETIQSLRDFGCLILVRDEDEACRITDFIAPEHLHIASDHAERLLPKIKNAGATFLGNYSPVALGDYAAGPSHVLPTGGTARWASGLSANHFLWSSRVIEYSAEALQAISADVTRVATVEGLTAHRRSVELRL